MAIAPTESLDDVLAVEREIGVALERERAGAEQWLQEARRAIDEAAKADLARLKEDATAADAAARKAAAQNAASIADEAKSLAARLETISDERLTPIVWKHLAAIAAGAQP